jgi:hypothetical protein
VVDLKAGAGESSVRLWEDKEREKGKIRKERK